MRLPSEQLGKQSNEDTTEQERTPHNATLEQPAIEKPLSNQTLKAYKLAQTAVNVIVNEQGSLEDIATAMPERFAHLKPDLTGSKRQHVYERLQSPAVKQEMQAIINKIDTEELANQAESKLAAIISHTPHKKPSAPQMVGIVTGLKLGRRLVEQAEVKQSQQFDLSQVKTMASEDRTALLLELIRLESAGVDVNAK